MKEEEFTEEELMEQDPLEVAGTPVKKEGMENEQFIIIEEPLDGKYEMEITDS